MDFMFIPDLDKNMHVVLVIVDIASDFTVAIYVCPGSRPTAELAKKSFDLGWLTWAGPPRIVEQDQDSTFMGEFETLRNDLGIVINNAAPEAHWQMGKVERKIRYLKEMAMSVFNAGEVRGQDSVAAAVRGMANACNQLVSTAGFSPQQWVLGYEKVLPGSILDRPGDLASRIYMASRRPGQCGTC